MKTPLVITPKKTYKSSNDNNWLSFTIFTLLSFLIVVSYGLIGSNFVYLIGLMKNGNSLFEKNIIQRLTPFYNDTHPTNNYKTVFGWFFDTLNTSYDTNISAMISLLSKIGNALSGHTNIQAMLSVVPFALLPIIAILICGANWFYMFGTGFLWAFIGLFMFYSFLVNSCISFVQICQYIYLFLLFPIFNDWSSVKNNMQQIQMSLFIFFGLLVCISAITSLNGYISATMAAMYIYWLIKQII